MSRFKLSPKAIIIILLLLVPVIFLIISRFTSDKKGAVNEVDADQEPISQVQEETEDPSNNDQSGQEPGIPPEETEEKETPPENSEFSDQEQECVFQAIKDRDKDAAQNCMAEVVAISSFETCLLNVQINATTKEAYQTKYFACLEQLPLGVEELESKKEKYYVFLGCDYDALAQAQDRRSYETALNLCEEIGN